MPDNERKDKRLYIRLNETEYKQLEELAKKLNLTKTEVVLKGISLMAEQEK